MPSNTRPNQYEVKRGSDVIFKGYPTYHGSYMKPCYLEFTNVSVPAPLDLQAGDEVNYTRLGETFKLYEIPEPKKQASSNQSGEAYVYDSIKFYDAAKVLEIALFRNLVENGQYHFSSDAEVNITTNVAGVAGMIQECLRSYTGDSTWSVYLYNDATMQSAYETAVAKDYSASGTCMNALDALSELWNGIGWVYRYINNVHTIIIGYPNVVATTAGYADNNRTMRFAMGSGLRNIKCTPAPIGDFCTRLYPFGSDRNMITGYYQNNTDVYQHASCYIKHLMLPLSEWGITDGKRDASKAFIRSIGLEADYGVIPKEIRFDGSGDYPEVYPSIEKVTAKNIRDAKTALEHTDYVPNATIYPDATRMDTIKAITMPTDDGTASSDGDKYTDKLDQTISSSGQVTVSIPSGRSEYIYNAIAYGTMPRDGIVRIDMSDIKFSISGASGLEIDTQSEFKAVFVELRTSLGTKQYDLTQYAEQTILSSYEASIPLITLPDLGTQNNPATGAYAIYLYVLLKNTTQSAITATGVFQNMEGQSSPLVIHWARKIVISDTFNIKLKQIGFDMKARVVQCGSSPVISMKSGMCAGREFSVVTKSVQYDASDDSWTMTLQRVKDESVGMVYPNTNYPIAVGDEFVILEIEMPEEYIHMASSRLSELANAAFSKLSSTTPTYEPELDSKYIFLQQSATTPAENTFLRVGKWMWLSDANVVGATDINILISSLTINEGESNIPTFKVSLVEFKRTGVVTQTQKQVIMLTSEVSMMQTAQRAAMRDYSSGDIGGGGTATGGNSVLPVYMDNGEAFPVEGIEVDGNIVSKNGGVSAAGMCDFTIHSSGGGGGGGTSNHSELSNLGYAASGHTGFQAEISDLATIRSNAQAGKTASDNLDGHTVAKNVPANAQFTDTIYDDTALSGRVTTIEGKEAGWDAKADASALTSHTSATNNPHSVTKAQVGLSQVDDTSDLNKPISTATQTALNGKAAKNGSSSEDFATRNLTASGGVSADGMCDFTIHGAGGGGVSDFDELTNRPKYNGTDMTHGTNIPEVKTSAWDAKQDAISDIDTIRSNASNGNTAYGWGNHASAGYLTSASNVSWSKLTGVPSTFTPSVHNHAASDVTSGTFATARIPSLAISKITGLQTALDGKQEASSAYNTGNANLSSVDWTCKALAMNGALTGATTGSFSGGVSTGDLTATGSVYPSNYLHLNNGKYITFKDSEGNRRNTFQVNASNHVVIGYGFKDVSGSNTEIWYNNELKFGHGDNVNAAVIDSLGNLSMKGGVSAKGICDLSIQTETGVLSEWQRLGSTNIYYKRIGHFVIMRGTYIFSSPSSGGNIGAIGNGYRPAYEFHKIQMVVNSNTLSVVTITISTSGVVSFAFEGNSPVGNFYFDGLIYTID